MSKIEQLESIRAQLTEARTALSAADAAFDADASVALAAKVATLERFTRELEPHAQAEIEAEATADARQRIRGIRSALGSLTSALIDDEDKVRELAAQLSAAIERTNQRFRSIEATRAEFEALVDRFSLDDEAPLRAVAEPDNAVSIDLPDLAQFSHRRPLTEDHPEVPRWQRRTYGEVLNTKGGEIIRRAGLKAWPELPPQVAQRIERDQQQAQTNAAVIERAINAAIPPTGSFALAGTI